MLTTPPDQPRADHAFLVEFSGASGLLVAVCPLYVVAVERTASGVAIRIARGSVADQVNVVGASVREVIDRLRTAWLSMQDSFLACFLRNDLSALEDRLMGRVMHQTAQAQAGFLDDMKGNLRTLVHQTVSDMAALDAPVVQNQGDQAESSRRPAKGSRR